MKDLVGPLLIALCSRWYMTHLLVFFIRLFRDQFSLCELLFQQGYSVVLHIGAVFEGLAYPSDRLLETTFNRHWKNDPLHGKERFASSSRIRRIRISTCKYKNVLKILLPFVYRFHLILCFCFWFIFYLYLRVQYIYVYVGMANLYVLLYMFLLVIKLYDNFTSNKWNKKNRRKANQENQRICLTCFLSCIWQSVYRGKKYGVCTRHALSTTVNDVILSIYVLSLCYHARRLGIWNYRCA